MKSIMEEASSIVKAIEKGWIQAGKPQEFTIKIFEDATKNFLGITTKPAKIGIFYTEKVSKPSQKQWVTREERQPSQQTRKPAPLPAQSPAQKTPRAVQQQEIVQDKRPRDVWTPEFTDFVTSWLKDSLQLMGKPTNFSVDTKNYYLKITFEHPIMTDQEKERFLFRNFAYLLMQSLRNKFKKNFRGFKIILSS